jgi:hypothetical protein
MAQAQQQPDLIRLFNVVDGGVTCPSGVGTSIKRVEGSVDVYKSVPAAYCDSKVFNPFTTARRRFERACLAKGTRFCGGYGISDEELPNLVQSLKEIGDSVARQKKDLLAIWPKPVEDWAKAHPAEADEIRRIAPSRMELDAAITFTVRVFKVENQGSSILEPLGISDGIDASIKGLCHQIASEIAQDVRETWKNRDQKDSTQLKGIRKAMQRWREKAKSMQFVDSRLGSIVDIIDRTASVLPMEGKVQGHEFLMLRGMVSILSSPDNILSGQMELKIESAETLPLDLVEPTAAATSPASPAPLSVVVMPEAAPVPEPAAPPPTTEPVKPKPMQSFAW